MISFNRRVLRILEEGGLIDSAVLQEASAAAAKGQSITQALLDRKAMAEPDLLGVLSERLGVPPVDLDRVAFPADVGEWMPEDLARKNCCVPIAKLGGLRTVAVANPFDVVRHDDLRLATGCDLRLALALESQIARATEKLYHSGERDLSELLDEHADHEITVKEAQEEEVVDLAALSEGSEEAPIVKLVNMIIYQGIKAKASDIHVEPFEKKTTVRYRVDGAMAEAMSPPRKLQNSITSRLKIMASLDI